MGSAHLRTGHDVVVPQSLGHPSLIDVLEKAAQAEVATFVEVMLHDTLAAVLERFRSRRAELSATGIRHP